MPEPSEIQHDLQTLATELKRLEAEYNGFFAGRLPRPPWETRATVTSVIKRLERAVQVGGTYAERFRFQTIQSRYATFADLWDRGLRAREEGRPGPFATRQKRAPDAAQLPAERVVYVALFGEPLKEADKLHELYERLTEVRRELGEAQVPFHKFAGLIRDQVESIQRRGVSEVAFRLAVRDGKLSLTARGMKSARLEK